MDSSRDSGRSRERIFLTKCEMVASSRESSSDTNSVCERSTAPSRSPPSPPSSVTSIDGQDRDNGPLRIPPPNLRSYYTCPFKFLDCNLSFYLDEFDLWYAHSASHFGNHQPPIHTICMFCDAIFQNDDPWRCWRERMCHIADHFDNGRSMEHARSDFALLHHLKMNKLITKTQYDAAAIAQEGIFIKSLRPHHYIPEKIKFRKYIEDRVSSQSVIDIDKEERERKKSKRKVRTRSFPRREKNVLQQDRLSTQLEKSPETPFTTALILRSNELNDFEQLAHDSSSSIDDSDISSDDEQSNAVSSLDFDRPVLLHGRLPPGIDRDEDLLDPKAHHQRLRNIRHGAFENSAVLQLDYRSRVVINDSRNGPSSVFDSFTDCCNILQRIQQNISMLKKSGFCQSQISFLKVDPRRSNVALLVAIPVDSIFRLCRAFEAGQTIKSQGTAFTSPYTAQESVTEKTSLETGAGTDYCNKELSQRLVGHTKMIIQTVDHGNVNCEPTCTILRIPHDPGDIRSAKITDSQLESSLGANPVPLALRGQGPLESWPAHGCLTVARGSVVVFNHGMRHSDYAEPRASYHTEEDAQLSHREGSSRRSAGSSDNSSLDMLDKSWWTTLAEECKALFQLLQMTLGNDNVKSIVFTALRTLDLIILSYAGAHTESFDDSPSRVGPRREFFRVSGSKTFRNRKPCSPQKGSITLARRTLRCLNGFFANQKVWVFHEETVDPRSTTSLLLSADPNDFADIWGPMWKIKDPEKPLGVIRYDLENGSIIPSVLGHSCDDMDLLLEDEEDICHWISDLDLKRERFSSTYSDSTAFITKPRLLIGAKKKVRVKINKEECGCTAAKVTKQLRNLDLLRPLGTSQDRRHIDSTTVSGGMSSGITPLQVNLAVTSKVIAGRTFKESVIKRWTHDKHRRNPYVLLEYAAVEVSSCTHNGRKIRLVDLLGTETISLLIKAIDPIMDSICKAAVTEALREQPERIINLFLENPCWREDIGNLVVCCLETLMDTGTTRDVTESFSMFWMYDHEEYVVRFPRRDYRWSDFIKDSDRQSSFVILEEKCLVFDAGTIAHGCQNPPKNGKDIRTEEAAANCGPIYETALLINSKLKTPPGLKLVKRKNSPSQISSAPRSSNRTEAASPESAHDGAADTEQPHTKPEESSAPSREILRWKTDQAIVGASFPMGDHGTLIVEAALPHSKLLVRFVPSNPIGAAFRSVFTLLEHRGSGLCHTEFVGNCTEEDYPRLGVFVLA